MCVKKQLEKYAEKSYIKSLWWLRVWSFNCAYHVLTVHSSLDICY